MTSQNVLAQEIEVTEIPTGNGFILLRTEALEMIDNYTNIVHAIRISAYSNALELIIENEALKNLSMDHTIINLIQEIKDKIFELSFRDREKRGLINLHGKFLKWIGGTMDDDDRVEIESKFNIVDKNLNIIADAVNNQTKINVKFESEMNNVIIKLNEQNSVINEKLKEIFISRNQMQKDLEVFKTRQLVKENLKYLLTKLEKLEDIMLSSRLGILSHNILTTEEIRKHNLNTDHLKFIKTAVGQTKEFILIFIQIPNFSKKKYYKTDIIPIPNKDNLELDTAIDKMIVYKNNVYYYTEKREIKKLQEIKEKCIKKILKNKLTDCNMVKNSKQEIVKNNKDIVITRNLKETELKHNCNNHRITIKGNNVIKFKDCKIKLNNVTFSNTNTRFIETIILPNVIKEIKYREPTNISISQMHLMHLKNNEEIKLLKYDTKKTNWINFVTIGGIIVGIIVTYLYLKYRKKTTSVEVNIRPEPNPKEGVVTYAAEKPHETDQVPKISVHKKPLSFTDESTELKTFSFS